MEYFIYYFITINIITFFIYRIDKYKAKKHRWRISENMLIGLAIMGGFIGAYIGMQIFRHKTKHMKFVLGLPLIAVIWVVVLLYYIVNFL